MEVANAGPVCTAKHGTNIGQATNVVEQRFELHTGRGVVFRTCILAVVGIIDDFGGGGAVRAQLAQATLSVDGKAQPTGVALARDESHDASYLRVCAADEC